MKKIFLLIAAFCAMSYFAACSDLLGEPKNNVAIATENGLSSGGAVLPVSSGEAMLSFSLDAKNDISCSALPNISADFFHLLQACRRDKGYRNRHVAFKRRVKSRKRSV